MILDIHTHHPAPEPMAVICVTPEEFNPMEGQLYSVGIHPWSLAGSEPDAAEWTRLESVGRHPQVVAIGETGLDMIKGGPLFRQLNALKRHIELSENIGKPLILHCVKAHEHIAQIRREMKPTQPWAIHGFRGKPAVARILLDSGCMLSFGLNFNPEVPRMIPPESMLAETDEAPVSIAEIITRLSAATGIVTDRLTEILASTSARFLHT